METGSMTRTTEKALPTKITVLPRNMGNPHEVTPARDRITGAGLLTARAECPNRAANLAHPNRGANPGCLNSPSRPVRFREWVMEAVRPRCRATGDVKVEVALAVAGCPEEVSPVQQAVGAVEDTAVAATGGDIIMDIAFTTKYIAEEENL
jgi:hypothetical protein